MVKKKSETSKAAPQAARIETKDPVTGKVRSTGIIRPPSGSGGFTTGGGTPTESEIREAVRTGKAVETIPPSQRKIEGQQKRIIETLERQGKKVTITKGGDIEVQERGGRKTIIPRGTTRSIVVPESAKVNVPSALVEERTRRRSEKRIKETPIIEEVEIPKTPEARIEEAPRGLKVSTFFSRGRAESFEKADKPVKAIISAVGTNVKDIFGLGVLLTSNQPEQIAKRTIIAKEVKEQFIDKPIKEKVAIVERGIFGAGETVKTQIITSPLVFATETALFTALGTPVEKALVKPIIKGLKKIVKTTTKSGQVILKTITKPKPKPKIKIPKFDEIQLPKPKKAKPKGIFARELGLREPKELLKLRKKEVAKLAREQILFLLSFLLVLVFLVLLVLLHL